MCFSFQIWSISNDSAKLRGLRECLFVRMYIYKLELNFSDFCKYSQISEINFPEKKHIEIPVKSSRSVSSINFENRLITGGKLSQINHRKASHQISKSSTSNLRHQSPKNMTKYVIVHLYSVLFTFRQISMKQVMSETGEQLFLRNRKTIRKAPIMDFKSFFTENLQLTAVDNFINVNETFWKLQ